MSILIKGMDMPTDKDCVRIIKIYADGSVWNRYEEVLIGKATPVPPHGDLIDRDLLIVDLMDRGVEGLQTDDWYEIQQSVLDAPTVIEAEGENNV